MMRFAPPVEAMDYGVCSHLTWSEYKQRNRAYGMAAAAGIRHFRCDFDWQGLQGDASSIDFSRPDTILSEVHAHGFDLLPILDYGNERFCPNPFNDLDGWCDYVQRIVSRYSTDVPVWEIWNEPDCGWTNCGGKPNPTNYYYLLKRSCAVIRNINPNARVAIGGFAGVPFKYIEALYQLGARDYFDIMNVHPYTGKPEGHLDRQLERLRALMARYGDVGKPIWATEFGWSTSERLPGFNPKTGKFKNKGGEDEYHQAIYLSRAMGMCFATGVSRIYPFELRSRERERYDRESDFGLVHGNFAPKPAFAAYVNFIDACPSGSEMEGGSWHFTNEVYHIRWRRPVFAEEIREGEAHGTNAGMIWRAHNEKMIYDLDIEAEKIRFFDAFGKVIYPETSAKGYKLVLSETPIFYFFTR